MPLAFRSSPPAASLTVAPQPQRSCWAASAVQLGTAFMRCEVANMYDAHRAALAQADDSCTVVTDLISGRPARYIKNKLIEVGIEGCVVAQDAPGDAGELVGQGDRELVSVQSLRRRLEPRAEAISGPIVRAH